MMHIGLLVTISALFCVCYSEVPDVTTIYNTDKPDEAKCYARTNALGLSFLQHDGGYMDPEDITNVPSCHVELNGMCPWEPMKWSIIKIGSQYQLPRSDRRDLRTFILKESGGWLRSPTFNATSRTVCLSFIYYLNNYDCFLEIYARVNDGIQELLEVVHSSNSSDATQWQVKRITLELEEDISTVVFIIQGYKNDPAAAVAVHGMMGCKAGGTEERAVMYAPQFRSERFTCKAATNIFVGSRTSTSAKHCTNCTNGGVCEPLTGTCVCPPGFTGIGCEQGCGMNLFGQDCEGQCSASWEGCRGMELCTPYVGCLCAPGYYGPQCRDSCPDGRYGGNCLQTCGQCRDNTICDVYSGQCQDGCNNGYYPPICREHYTFLLAPPVVTNVSCNKATISFSTNEDEFGGRGSPEFYRIEYLVEGKWFVEPAKLLPKTTGEVQYQLSELPPGKSYQLRGVLIDRDGNYFVDNSTHILANFSTLCEMPEHPLYYHKIDWVTKNAFALEWTYLPNSITACPTVNYKVYVEGNLYTTTNNSKVMVRDRNPYTSYQVWVQAVTTQGGTRISRPIEILTEQAAPSAVINLTFTKISPTELPISWNPPLFRNGIIKHYNIEYRCLRYLACPEEQHCDMSHGNVTSIETNVTLSNLIPHSQYDISVAAFTVEAGPYSRITAVTLFAEPDAAPEPSLKPIEGRSSKSLTMTWLPVEDCRKLNGFPVGYLYSLYRVAANMSNILVSTNNITRPPVVFNRLLPDQDYELHVRQLVNGNLFSSKNVLVISGKTCAKLAPAVQNLRVTNSSSHAIDIDWEFVSNESTTKNFIVSIRCLQILACPPQENIDCSSTVSSITNETNARITGLPPHANYLVQVAALEEQVGLITSMVVTTPVAAAEVSPVMPAEPVKARGSTWAVIQWLPPDDCTLFHGNFVGYGQRLKTEGELLQQSISNLTTLSMNLTQLMPFTEYEVEIFIVTSSQDSMLELFSNQSINITFKTRPPVPNPVTELVSYSHGLDHMALRYKTPEYSYGIIDSVTLQYQNLKVNGEIEEKQMKASQCKLWPNLMCVMLEGLQPYSHYRVMVRVWNSELKEEGEPRSITVITDEKSPGAPTFLQLLNRTDTTFTLHWGIPTILNGILRGFSIDYYQFASFNPSWCCMNRTTLSTTESVNSSYTMKVTGLRPSSSYVIEVRAVTNMPGPSVSLVEHTLPSTPQFKAQPQLILDSIKETSALVTLALPIEHPYLSISAFFVVVHSPVMEDIGTFDNAQLQNEISALIGPKAYIAIELEEAELARSRTVIVGNGGDYQGVYGEFVNKQLQRNTTYSVELLAMASYKGSRVFGRATSKPFHTKFHSTTNEFGMLQLQSAPMVAYELLDKPQQLKFKEETKVASRLYEQPKEFQLHNALPYDMLD